MAQNHMEIFSTRADFVAVLKRVEERLPVSYVLAGLFEVNDVRSFSTSAEVDALLRDAREPFVFLAHGKQDRVIVREVPQNDGGVRYGVDQSNNPGSVTLRPGWMPNERTIIAGQISTISQERASLELLSAFSRAARRDFVKVKSYWVGPEALRILDGGGRLAATVKAPPQYDLRR